MPELAANKARPRPCEVARPEIQQNRNEIPASFHAIQAMAASSHKRVSVFRVVTPERWHRVKELFYAARDLEPSSRPAPMSPLCQDLNRQTTTLRNVAIGKAFTHPS